MKNKQVIYYPDEIPSVIEELLDSELEPDPVTRNFLPERSNIFF